jgi:hypothetical protein
MVGADGQKIKLVNYNNAKNPTYAELISFMKSDNTDKLLYKYDSFTCGDFAERLHNNAEKAGYKAAWVPIDFTENNLGHCCNAFQTTDKGLIYVDCTGTPDGADNHDTVVSLKVGQSYIPQSITNSNYHFYSMGTVKDFKTYW